MSILNKISGLFGAKNEDENVTGDLMDIPADQPTAEPQQPFEEVTPVEPAGQEDEPVESNPEPEIINPEGSDQPL